MDSFRTSFLHAGCTFTGTQNVLHGTAVENIWTVNVVLQGCDVENGYLCGSMEALNVPAADCPVLTFWEGEIIDNKHFTFLTGQWDATRDTDLIHWSKFPSFHPLRDAVIRDGGRFLHLDDLDYIFMRWKERFFVNVGADCGLTIAGFYYVCFHRETGSVEGIYYDPLSPPFQKLALQVSTCGRHGFAFPEYSFA